jgi:UDP-N-acetylmuramoyl-tripeptide--D-alanyl-D-alanine ligase
MKHLLKRVVERILYLEARILLARKKPKIIGVTGNVGKTSAKDAIYTVISHHVRARKSEKSFNSDIGVPLTILGLPNAWGSLLGWCITLVEGLFIAVFSREYPQWLVIEMGVDRPGDMKRLAELVKPDIVVLTRFPDVPVHIEYFKTPEAVIKEKMELVYALSGEGVVIYNNDDANIRTALEGIPQQCIGFGSHLPAPYTASKGQITYDENMAPSGYTYTITHGAERVEVKIVGSLGLHNAYTSGAAFAVAGALGMSLTDAAEACKTHTTPRGRMRLIPGASGATLIDDTYNASPLAMTEGIHALHEIDHAKRRIAVLGDMLELGRYSVKEHEKIGRLVVGKVDALMTVGVRAKSIAEMARESGMKDTRILEANDAETAASGLRDLIKAGDVVYIKGSQGMRMEKIVKALMREPKQASELLVRQDEMWKTLS